MKTSPKGFIAPLLLALIALLLIGGGAYVYVQNKEISQNVVVQNSDWKTYANSQYGFEFQYKNNEKVELLNPTVNMQSADALLSGPNIGEKIISIQVNNTKDVSGVTCIQGVDTRCNNISVGGHNIVMQYGMTGHILARVDLSKEKTLLFSLSCDSIGDGPSGKNNYCVISATRTKSFEDSLSTFKFSP